MYGFQVREVVIPQVHTEAEEEPGIAPIHNLKVPELQQIKQANVIKQEHKLLLILKNNSCVLINLLKRKGSKTTPL